MKVSAAGYFAWRRRLKRPPSLKRRRLGQAVGNCFWENRRRYGSRRIQAALAKMGVAVGRFQVRSLMREQGLRAIAPRRFKPRTTDSNHDSRISPNLLKETAKEIYQAGEMIVGDITYLPMRNGRWCYLASFQDKFTRRVVGWQVAEKMTAQLVVDAFLRARRRGLIEKGAIVHTTRGSQYASVEYRRLLHIHGFRQSMSAKGNCYDNAQAESFFSRFKAELIENGIFESVEQAKSEIFSYIEGYYNRTRLHSSLGYKSPMEFEMELKIKNQRRKDSFVSTFS
jgi:transposase InsO family protein